MQDPSASLFFLKGFHRLQQEGKNFLVHAALVSRVSEGCLAELMTDPRVALTYEDLWKSLAEDMA
eukprot:7405157-Lingulodinium_polyedra.AAC.1